jgi:transcriptional regulator with PAS, ATPase and Fis domain
MAIHINQSLVHMEKEIIRRVMQAEHMNQSRAAKRLGISRSTLWRKLNAGHLNTKEDENEKFEQ